jgi:hypothetical protein
MNNSPEANPFTSKHLFPALEYGFLKQIQNHAVTQIFCSTFHKSLLGSLQKMLTIGLAKKEK